MLVLRYVECVSCLGVIVQDTKNEQPRVSRVVHFSELQAVAVFAGQWHLLVLLDLKAHVTRLCSNVLNMLSI